MIRFIHAADLHLDTPFTGIEQTSNDLAKQLREAPFQSFEKIVDTAIDRVVDFVLLSGDLYNTQRVNIKAQSLFIEQLKRLEDAEIAVFLIRGNHDYITEESKTLTLPFPKNVHTYTEQVDTHIFETKNKERVAISGFSYGSQWIHERKINEFPRRMENVDMHIGLLHGDVESNHSKNGNYAPFTIAELRQKNYDYWALGHVHQRLELTTHPLVNYPGNIQGLHKNETGAKGCLLIEWTDREEKVEFIPTAPIFWEKISFNLSDIQNVSMLIQEIQQKILEKKSASKRLIHLIVQTSKEDNEELIQFIQGNEFAKQMTRQIDLSHVWIATTELVVNETSDQKALEKLYPKEWTDAVDSAKHSSAFNEITEQIFNNIPSKYLNQTNSKTYRKQMIEKAIAKIHLK